jgi:hypothetical protein
MSGPEYDQARTAKNARGAQIAGNRERCLTAGRGGFKRGAATRFAAKGCPRMEMTKTAGWIESREGTVARLASRALRSLGIRSHRSKIVSASLHHTSPSAYRGVPNLPRCRFGPQELIPWFGHKVKTLCFARSAGRRGARRPFEFGWIRRDLSDCDTRRQKKALKTRPGPQLQIRLRKNSEPRARKDNRVALPTESRAGSTPNTGWQKSVARKKSARSPQIPTPN